MTRIEAAAGDADLRQAAAAEEEEGAVRDAILVCVCVRARVSLRECVRVFTGAFVCAHARRWRVWVGGI